jgi:hypothetical protein
MKRSPALAMPDEQRGRALAGQMLADHALEEIGALLEQERP